jgi:hypothetical protein
MFYSFSEYACFPKQFKGLPGSKKYRVFNDDTGGGNRLLRHKIHLFFSKIQELLELAHGLISAATCDCGMPWHTMIMDG